LRVHICGARGSSPAPGASFLRYGGHTPCLALAHDGAAVPTLVLDAGTGITQVTALLGGSPFAGAVVLTHLHWDHVQGLPFFAGADDPGASVVLRLPAQPDGADAVSVLSRAMSPPHFPIGPEDLRGSWDFGSIEEGEHEFGGFHVLSREVPHKGGRTFGYRISDDHSTLTFIPDHRPTALGPGEDGFGALHPAALELTRDADVLIHDGQLLPAEIAEAEFGHAVVDYAVGLGRAAGAGEVLLFHHKPNRTDDELDQLAARFGDDPRVRLAADHSLLEL
jgi:phosphoribosyl 1,2-cyclic phosphodiesterase